MLQARLRHHTGSIYRLLCGHERCGGVLGTLHVSYNTTLLEIEHNLFLPPGFVERADGVFALSRHAARSKRQQPRRVRRYIDAPMLLGLRNRDVRARGNDFDEGRSAAWYLYQCDVGRPWVMACPIHGHHSTVPLPPAL